jgi:hypothetical protein
VSAIVPPAIHRFASMGSSLPVRSRDNRVHPAS